MSNWISKYRPKTFKTFYGDENTVKDIETKLSSKNPVHTWLITGSYGSGKTSLARIMSRKLLNCGLSRKIEDHPDYNEINIGPDRSIEKMREIIEQARFLPKEGKYKIFVLDEVHQLLKDSASALLKILEEPPKTVIFILATNHPEKLLDTIRSRAYKIHLPSLDVDGTLKVVNRICKLESLDFISKEIRKTIAQNLVGKPREVINTLYSLSDLKSKNITQNDIEKVILEQLESAMVQASKILIALYTKKFKDACQLCQSFDDIPYLINCMLDLNHFLIQKSTGVYSYISVPRKVLLKAVAEKPLTSINNFVIVQEALFAIKKEISYTSILDPKQVILTYLCRCMMALKDQK